MPTLRKLKNVLRTASPRSRRLFNQFVRKYGNDNFVLNMGPAVPNQWVLLRKSSRCAKKVYLQGGNGATFEKMLESDAYKNLKRVWKKRLKNTFNRQPEKLAKLNTAGNFEIIQQTEDLYPSKEIIDNYFLVFRSTSKQLIITCKLSDFPKPSYRESVYLYTNVQTKKYTAENYNPEKRNVHIIDILDKLVDEWNLPAKLTLNKVSNCTTILIIGMQMKELTEQHLTQLVERLKLRSYVQICLLDRYARTGEPTSKQIDGKTMFICSVQDTMANFGRFVPEEGCFDYVLMDKQTIQHISPVKGSKYETACMGRVLKNGGKLFLQELEHRAPDNESFTTEEIEEAKTHFSPTPVIKLNKTVHDMFPEQQDFLQIFAEQADSTKKLLYPKRTATVGNVKAVSGFRKTTRVSIINKGLDPYDERNLFKKERNDTLLLDLVNDSGVKPLNDLVQMFWRVKSFEQINEILQTENLQLVKEHKEYIFSYKRLTNVGPDNGKTVVAEWVKVDPQAEPPATACIEGIKLESGVCLQRLPSTCIDDSGVCQPLSNR